MARDPAIYHKLQAVLDAEFPGGESDWNYAKAKNIPLLEGIIYETLRLKPSVPGGMPRATPPGGLQIDEMFIPGGINVSVPTYAIQRDPKYWKRPLEFFPERWETITPESVPFLPFTKGKYMCPGKNLAIMEMTMVLSRVALRYKLGPLEEDIGEKFENGHLDTFTMSVPALPLVFTRR